MSTTTKWTRGSPLPSKYWVENPNPGNATKEWQELWHKVSGGDTSTGHNRWYHIPAKGFTAQMHTPTTGEPCISWEDWRDTLNGVVQQGYKVGDYVVVTKFQNGDPIGTLSQIMSNTGGSNWSIKKYPDGIRYWGASENCIRPATEEEIAQAQGTPLSTESKEWKPKVGEWIWTDKTNYGDYHRKAVQVLELKSEYPQRLYIMSGGWFNKEDARLATPEEIRKAEGKPDKQYICTSEDGVKLYDKDEPFWVYNGNKGWVWKDKIALSPLHVMSTGSLTQTVKDGEPMWKVFSTESAAKAWIEQQNNPQQIPVTKGQIAKIKKGSSGIAENYGGQWGEIIKVKENYWYDLKMKDEVVVTCYPSEIEEIKSSTSKTIINSQTKTKTTIYGNTTESAANNASAIKLSSVTRTIRRPIEGPAVAVRRQKQPKRVIRVA